MHSILNANWKNGLSSFICNQCERIEFLNVRANQNKRNFEKNIPEMVSNCADKTLGSQFAVSKQNLPFVHFSLNV